MTVDVDSDLYTLNKEELVQVAVQLRTAIRYHRDQKGDDRCWLDDLKLYESLPEYVQIDATLPPKAEFLGSCTKFWECRQGKSFKNQDDCYDSGKYRSLNVPEQEAKKEN